MEKNEVVNGINSINSSADSPQQKLEKLNNLLGGLNPHENRAEILSICNSSIKIATFLDRPEMLAQIYLIIAKNEIALSGPIIYGMKNLKMAIRWLNFSLERDQQKYNQLNSKLENIWKKTQKNIDISFEYLKQNPVSEIVAHCYQSRGEIYGAFYLDLKLLYLNSGAPLIAKISNYKIIRWLNMDDILSMSKSNIIKINKIKKDCLDYFKESAKLFKQEKEYAFLINCYINLSFEYHSFNSPIRSKIYEYRAKYLIKKHKLSKNLTIQNNLKNLEDQPLIGSNRDNAQSEFK